MANKTTIRADKLLNTAVDIKDQAGAARVNGYAMLVDTGATITVVGYNDAVKGGTWKLGALGGGAGVGGAGLPFIDVQGGTMTIETEQQGGGVIQNKTCAKIKAVFGANPFNFVGGGAKGIFGMDQMDVIQADPQKNAAANAARLARR